MYVLLRTEALYDILRSSFACHEPLPAASSPQLPTLSQGCSCVMFGGYRYPRTSSLSPS
ncbi:hypothetical protein PAXRUDRAFT_829208 [Paxillus rubicundulus Ve08.2h10]|uniref:Uncharacterized protein n=1 Tax=Paxillus rubicundulus Ve08.2h10 TaxID=930991 RepID=A0A0D0E0D3_9AGAM|nr:hypothetical protein PAXRUDRAFT_829208 [Paxillus rubicundulus Ve08.2h10]